MGKYTAQDGNPGKHDEIAERLSLDLNAAAVVLIVIGGRRGSGMSVSLDPKGGQTREAMSEAELAGLLRLMADSLDAGQGPDGRRIALVEPQS